MTPHQQLIPHDPASGKYGDCQRTCVAVILDLHPSEVPHFCDKDAGDWAALQAAWLKDRGLACATVAYDGSASFEQVMTWTSRQSPDVPMILLGTSSLGCNHVVVVLNGEIVCDPSGNGIVGPAIEGVWEVSMICVGSDLTPPVSVVEAMEKALRQADQVSRDLGWHRIYDETSAALADLEAWRAGK